MSEREERHELARALCSAESVIADIRHGGNDWFVRLFAWDVIALAYLRADAILASDWLKARDQRVREECAKVAERVGQEFLSPEYAFPQPIGSIQERFACAQVAAAIRGDAK